MTRGILMAAGMVAALLAASCGSGEKRQLVVAFSQANNAEPYRAAQNALMTKLFSQYADVKRVISDAQQRRSSDLLFDALYPALPRWANEFRRSAAGFGLPLDQCNARNRAMTQTPTGLQSL